MNNANASMSNEPRPVEKRLIKRDEVTRKTGLQRTAIYDRMAAGTFPQAVKLGTTARWLLSEIDAWIDEQVAARDGAATQRAA